MNYLNMKFFLATFTSLCLLITSTGCSDNLKSKFEDCYTTKISPIELIYDNDVKERIIKNYSQHYYDKLLSNTDFYSQVYRDSSLNCYYFFAWKDKKYNTSDNIQLRYYVKNDSLATILRIEDLEIDKSGNSDYHNWKQNLESTQTNDFISSLKNKAEKGEATAQYLLGVCYADGIGVESNIDKAIELYNKSANQGNSQALYPLSFIYNLKNESKKSKDCLKLAAERGNREAQSLLSRVSSSAFLKT